MMTVSEISFFIIGAIGGTMGLWSMLNYFNMVHRPEQLQKLRERVIELSCSNCKKKDLMLVTEDGVSILPKSSARRVG